MDFSLLHQLHRLLKQISDIRERIARGPRKIKMVTANEAQFLGELESAKAAVTEIRMACDRKELQLNGREAKIHDLQGRMNSADSNKEFQLLKERIAADEQANAVLQDEILEQLERLDTLTAKLKTADANHKKSHTETQRMTDKVELDTNALTLELERVTVNLAEAEKKLPADLVGEYRRLVAGLGEDALGETDMENCGNCNHRLTTQMSSELMMSRSQVCEGCGCILYVPEKRRAGY